MLNKRLICETEIVIDNKLDWQIIHKLDKLQLI